MKEENNKEKKECSSPVEEIEKSPQKKWQDRAYNQIQDNLELSSKVPFTPDPLTSLLQSAKKEFDQKFNWATFCWNGDNKTGEKFAKQQKSKVKSFLTSKLTEAYYKGKQTKL